MRAQRQVSPVHRHGFVACLGGRGGGGGDGGNELNFEWRVGGFHAGILRRRTCEVGGRRYVGVVRGEECIRMSGRSENNGVA